MIEVVRGRFGASGIFAPAGDVNFNLLAFDQIAVADDWRNKGAENGNLGELVPLAR
jgi:hypothetical protein